MLKNQGFSHLLRTFINHTARCASILMVTAVMCCSTEAHSAEPAKKFENTVHGIKFSYSADFERVKTDSPETLVLLRTKAQGFPTFNVIVQGGSYDLTNITPADFAKQTIESYGKVGISGAKALRAYKAPLGGLESISAEILYPHENQKLIAAVSAVTLSDRHFVFTYIDNAENFYQRKVLREDIVNSVELDPSVAKLMNGAADSDQTAENTDTRSIVQKALPYILALAGILLLLGLAIASRSKS